MQCSKLKQILKSESKFFESYRQSKYSVKNIDHNHLKIKKYIYNYILKKLCDYDGFSLIKLGWFGGLQKIYGIYLRIYRSIIIAEECRQIAKNNTLYALCTKTMKYLFTWNLINQKNPII